MQLRTWLLPALPMPTGLCTSSQIELWRPHMLVGGQLHAIATPLSLEEAGAHSWTEQPLLRYLAVLPCPGSCSTRTKVQRGACTCKASTSFTAGWWLLVPCLAHLMRLHWSFTFSRALNMAFVSLEIQTSLFLRLFFLQHMNYFTARCLLFVSLHINTDKSIQILREGFQLMQPWIWITPLTAGTGAVDPGCLLALTMKAGKESVPTICHLVLTALRLWLSFWCGHSLMPFNQNKLS